MRTINNLAVPKETDLAKFPDSTILNETETTEGTPVVREIYGDVLTNIYAYLRDRKIIPNQIEDNELNGYQLIKALQKNVNELNDVERILTKVGSTWNIPLDLSLVPDKYFIFARASESYVPANEIGSMFKGTGDTTYNFSSSGFSASDELLIIIDQATVRAYSLTSIISNSQSANEVFTVFGSPVSYMDSEKIWYFENGKVFSDLPEVIEVQETLRNREGENSLLVFDVFCISNNLLVLAFFPVESENKYKFFRFPLNSPGTVIDMSISGFDLSNNGGVDKGMHAFFDDYLYLSNLADSDDANFKFIKAQVDFNTNDISFISSFDLNAGYVKSTNSVINGDSIVSLMNGQLVRCRFDGTAPEAILNIDSYVGLLFKIKNAIYYTNGEVAKKWTIPA